MNKDETIKMLKGDNYNLARKVEKLEKEKKILQKQLKDAEKEKERWHENFLRIKGDL